KTKFQLMRKSVRFSIVLFTALIFSLATFAQTVTLSGKVTNSATSEGIGSVSVTVKGTNEGTYTDPNGDFKLNVKRLPVTLVFSSVGFDQQELTVNTSSDVVNISLTPGSSLGQEVVISATRTPQRILESPVSIERLGSGNIRNAASPD